MFKLYSQAAVIVLAMGILAGCGQFTALSAAGTPSALRAQGDFGQGGFHQGPKFDGPLGLLSVADLTDDQKAQLKAIAEKYKPQKPEQGAEKPGAKLQELLAADPLDAAALKAALESKTDRPAPDMSQHFAALKEARAVLTDAQRATLVEKLKTQPSPAPKADAKRPERPEPTAEQKQQKLDKLAEKLKLTETQKAAFAAFQAKLDATKPAPTPRPDFTAHRDAMVTFIETGDTAALEALKPALTPPAFPVDEFVALAQTLSPEQRKQLLAQPFGGKGGHGKPHGGSGGKAGFKGGFGHGRH